ncbi:MAG: RecQ family ATP-dependent DNA helicase, partial [Hoylesella buccalis]
CMRCDVCLEHYTDQTSEEKIKPAQDQIKHFLNDGEKHHLTELHQLSIARRQLDEALEMLIAEEEITIEGSYIFLHP